MRWAYDTYRQMAEAGWDRETALQLSRWWADGEWDEAQEGTAMGNAMTIMALVSDSGWRGVTVEECVTYGSAWGMGREQVLEVVGTLLQEGSVRSDGERLYRREYR